MSVLQKIISPGSDQTFKSDDWPRDFDIRAEFAEQQELLEANYQHSGIGSQLEESGDE